MKILWVDFALPYLLKDASSPVGGWAVELRSWLVGTERTGHQGGVLTWLGAKEYVGQEFPFELVETYNPNKGTKYIKYVTNYIPAMQRAVNQTKYDVIIQACASAMTGMAAYVAQRAGIPFVYRVASDMDVDKRCEQRLKKYEQMMYRYGLSRSALILCQNQYQFDAVVKKYPQKPVALVPNPFAIIAARPLEPLMNRSYIAWLGVFRHPKNLPRLLKITRSLPDVKFRIAGTRSSTVDAATDEALAALEKMPNVEFVGYLKREEVMLFLGGAVALLNTSHYEGFSNTYLESFSRGTPVIAPQGADPDGIIRRFNLGRSVLADDEFPTAIAEIMGLGETYSELGARCQAYVRDHHDPKKLMEKVVDKLTPLIQANSEIQ